MPTISTTSATFRFTAIVATILAANGAFGQTATATADMRVTATVARSCSIDAISDLAFGTLSSTATTTASTEIDVTCTSANPGEVSVALQFDGGLNPDSGVRRMKNLEAGSNAFVPYTISASGSLIGIGAATNATSLNNGQAYNVNISGAVVNDTT
jgi:spore coat protein U-like protein